MLHANVDEPDMDDPLAPTVVDTTLRQYTWTASPVTRDSLSCSSRLPVASPSLDSPSFQGLGHEE